ncbi:MAG: hypothetical protein AAB403_14525, partial [Planctomycetota bacterium]
MRISVAYRVTATVTNRMGATNVTQETAWLNGGASAGDPAPAFAFFWGPTDGGTTRASWSNRIDMGTLNGDFTTNVTGLLANRIYYYRAYASNSAAESWAPSTTNFQTLPPAASLSVGSSSFAENGGQSVVTASLSAVSYSDVTVNLGFSGTATTNVDYSSSSTQIVIAAGAADGSITLTGINDGLIEGTESVNILIGSLVNATNGGVTNVTATVLDNDNMITVGTNGNGTITPGSAVVDDGGSTNFVFSAAANCHVTSITTNGGHIADSPYSGNTVTSTNVTWDNVTADGTITGSFAIDTHTLTASSAGNGSVTTPGEGVFTNNYGATPAIVATPAANYHFAFWSGTAADAGKIADTNAAGSTVTVHGDYTAVANFAIDTHTLTASSAGNGSV